MNRPTSAPAVSVRAEKIRIVRLPLGEEVIRPTFRRERAVAGLPVRPQLVFVDGRDRIDVGCDCQAVVSGDAILASIAAASIVAKVTRDRLMTRLGLLYPGYGFEQHKGYSVPEHFAALARLGPTIHHRRSFAPVAAAYGDVVTEDMETGEVEPGALPL